MANTERKNRFVEELLTPKEIAEILRIGYRSVLDLILMGKLEAYRVGRVYRISRSDLQSYLESTKVRSRWM